MSSRTSAFVVVSVMLTLFGCGIGSGVDAEGAARPEDSVSPGAERAVLGEQVSEACALAVVVFADADRDGTLDFDESGLPGICVVATRIGDGVSEDEITDVVGFALFSLEGTYDYRVEVDLTGEACAGQAVSACPTTSTSQLVAAAGSDLCDPASVSFGLVLRPDGLIMDLIGEVDALLAAGELNGGQRKSLVKQLSRSENKLARCRINAACNQLADVIQHVNDLVAEGSLGAIAGLSLIAGVENVRSELGC